MYEFAINNLSPTIITLTRVSQLVEYWGIHLQLPTQDGGGIFCEVCPIVKGTSKSATIVLVTSGSVQRSILRLNLWNKSYDCLGVDMSDKTYLVDYVAALFASNSRN